MVSSRLSEEDGIERQVPWRACSNWFSWDHFGYRRRKTGEQVLSVRSNDIFGPSQAGT
jgi:hypothetical protein